MQIQLDPKIAEAAGQGVERIRTAGDRGATQITTEEAAAMARTIVILLAQIERLEVFIEALQKGDQT